VIVDLKKMLFHLIAADPEEGGDEEYILKDCRPGDSVKRPVHDRDHNENARLQMREQDAAPGNRILSGSIQVLSKPRDNAQGEDNPASDMGYGNSCVIGLGAKQAQNNGWRKQKAQPKEKLNDRIDNKQSPHFHVVFSISKK
jgi:hypothetical protein